MKYRISANVIRRLPRYLRRLTGMEKAGIVRTSSADLSRRMGLTASQIRQDLNCFGGFGQQGYGYRVSDLKASIAEALGVPETLTSDYGCALSAAFDTDPALVGTEISGVPILDGARFGEYLKEHRVDVAVLTLPKKFARDAAMTASAGGVRGIWNFTGIDIDADLGDTVMENVHLSDSLLTLGYYLRGRTDSGSPARGNGI